MVDLRIAFMGFAVLPDRRDHRVPGDRGNADLSVPRVLRERLVKLDLVVKTDRVASREFPVRVGKLDLRVGSDLRVPLDLRERMAE